VPPTAAQTISPPIQIIKVRILEFSSAATLYRTKLQSCKNAAVGRIVRTRQKLLRRLALRAASLPDRKVRNHNGCGHGRGKSDQCKMKPLH
jgi:hypothetical protein